jgi:hypothetical protein
VAAEPESNSGQSEEPAPHAPAGRATCPGYRERDSNKQRCRRAESWRTRQQLRDNKCLRWNVRRREESVRTGSAVAAAGHSHLAGRVDTTWESETDFSLF